MRKHPFPKVGLVLLCLSALLGLSAPAQAATCNLDADCDDEVFCNGVETCNPGDPQADPLTGCVAGSPPDCDDGVHCTDTLCDAALDTCVVLPVNARCSNGIFCDGEEVCDPENGNAFGCRAGTPVVCDDGLSCTNDVCSNAQARCVYTPINSRCDDGVFCNGVETCDPENPAHDADGCVSGEPVTCNDGIGCTLDECDENTQGCVYIPSDAACDDNNPCTGPDLCDPDDFNLWPSGCDRSWLADGTLCQTESFRGICLSGACYNTCFNDGHCDDGVPCTTDLCVGGSCVNSPVHSLCDDGLFCNGEESCDPSDPQADGNGCAPGETVVCDDLRSCTDDSCSNDLAACVFTPVHSRCDDDLYCNGVEQCAPAAPGADGVTGCVAGTAVVCNDGVSCTSDRCDNDLAACVYDPEDSACEDGNPCTLDTCDAQAGCQSEPLADGTGCGAGKACHSGLCVTACTTDNDCDDGIACTVDVCDTQSGTCLNTPSQPLCDDGNVCTGTATCNPGAPGADPSSGCVAGTPLVCGDSDPCTAEFCDTTLGCVYPPAPDGTACDTLPGIPEICMDGHCLPKCSSDSDCNDGADCTEDICDFGSGLCFNEPIPNFCNDFLVCNGLETCDPTHPGAHGVSGCVAGTPLVCDDGVSCTTNACSNSQGGCVFTPNHAVCNDGDVCNGAETCDPVWGCLPGTPLTCDDGNPCTGWACDMQSGCLYPALPDGTACDIDPSVTEVCSAGQCVPYCANDGDCDDGIACTLNTCDPVTHTCVRSLRDSVCDDQNVCTGTAVCAPESPGANPSTGCVAGTPLVCNDGIACTVNTCDPVLGCQTTLNSAFCDNTIYCDGEETCNPSHPGAHPTTGCVAGTPVNCADGFSCTLTYCDNASRSCVTLPQNAACDDGNYCNGTESCNPQGPGADPLTGCVTGAPPVCDDGIACTRSECDPELGACVHTPDNSLCDNNLYCDGEETCHPQLGCQPGTPVLCDDGVACTQSTCSEVTRACVHTPNHGVCQNGIFCDGQEICDPVQGCMAGTPPNCDDGIACTTTFCDSFMDACVAEPNHTACDDGMFCNGEELCMIGLGCMPGAPPACSDGIACTVDTCDEPSRSCVHTPDNALCSDGLFCNGTEICSRTLGCLPGDSVTCDDGIACTVNSCSNAQGACVYTPNDGLCPPAGSCRDLIGCDPVDGCLYQNHPANQECTLPLGGSGFCQNGLCVAGCALDTDCNDGIACTTDTCGPDGRCVHTPLHQFCDNGVFCDGDELCVAGLGCVAGPTRNCDDGVYCTLDSCDEANRTCVNQPRHEICADSLWCNGDELCVPGHTLADGLGCVAGQSPCEDGIACTLNLCDESGQSCEALPQNSHCDDGIFCNGAELCDPEDENADAQGCVAGSLPDCNDGIACTVNACDPDLDRCVATALDSLCDDGAFCTGVESCNPENPAADVNGCVAGSNPCDDGVLCTLNLCDEHGQSCTNPPSDALCSDGLFCTGVENCDPANPAADVNGCVPGDDPCDDGVACTQDSCDEAQGRCIHTPDAGACNDGVFCNGVEICDPQAGCLPGTPPSCDDGIACTQDRCDPALDTCVHEPNDSACDDGVFCNGAEVCVEDVGCVAGTPPSCDDGIACTTDVCNPIDDACQHIPVHARCDDGLFCTGVETCDPLEGCLPGAPPVCDDGVSCTVGVCDAQADECRFTPDDSRCDDGLFCNGVETCDPLAGCLPGTPPDCDDGVDCTIDFCDTEHDLCIHELDHDLCDDGLFCTGDEFCSVEGCYTVARVCDDGHGCTQDSCNEEQNRCDFIPDDALCDDGNPCTGPGVCDPDTGCLNAPLADGTACSLNDGLDESCQGGFCVPECLTHADCDDGIACTQGSCGARGHCQYAADDDVCNAGLGFCDPVQTCVIGVGCVAGEPPDCDDTIACTVDSCDAAGQRCVHEPNHDLCNDFNPCTRNECDPTAGCVNEALDDGTPCGTDYVCRDGECVPPIPEDGDEPDGDEPDGDGPDGDWWVDGDDDPVDIDPDLPDGDRPDGDEPDGDDWRAGGGGGGCAQSGAQPGGLLLLALLGAALWRRRIAVPVE